MDNVLLYCFRRIKRALFNPLRLNLFNRRRNNRTASVLISLVIVYVVFKFASHTSIKRGSDNVVKIASSRNRKEFTVVGDNVTEFAFARWRNRVVTLCDGRLTTYGGKLARLRDVVIDRKLMWAARIGGEPLHEVMNQDIDAEYYKMKIGCFRLHGCSNDTTVNLRSVRFEQGSYLNRWLTATELLPEPSSRTVIKTSETPHTSPAVDETRSELTIALTRDEYANIYHATSDWFNVFLVTKLFQSDTSTVSVLLIDAHPAGPLDEVWSRLFDGGVTRLSQLHPGLTLFKNLVWATPGHKGPFEQHFLPNLPLVEQFRSFVLSRYDVSDNHVCNCSNMTVLLILRRDYVTHPRNPAAVVRRKIANEDQLVAYLRQHNPSVRIHDVQLDVLSVEDQLKLTAKSDIIIGMHGAGLTHAMFMPKGSGLIELMPAINMAANWHFRSIARWRRLVYDSWINQQLAEEKATGYKTEVPPEVVNRLLQKVIRKICSFEHYLSLKKAKGKLRR